MTYEHAREIIANLKLHDFNRHSCNRGLTARAKSLLQEAHSITIDQRQCSIEPEHIMQALLNAHNSLASLLFEALELDAKQLEQELKSVIQARLQLTA
jgi:ATP-dependent Clp protease ATP-binding subunit ClpA